MAEEPAAPPLPGAAAEEPVPIDQDMVAAIEQHGQKLEPVWRAEDITGDEPAAAVPASADPLANLEFPELHTKPAPEKPQAAPEVLNLETPAEPEPAAVSGYLGPEAYREVASSSESPVELALLARLRACDPEERGLFSFEQAVEHVMWALHAEAQVPSSKKSIVKPRPFQPWDRIVAVFALVAGVVLVVTFILVATRALYRDVSVTHGGILLASGAPAYSANSPLAATGLAVEIRNLLDCVALPVETLRKIRDVTVLHKGVWRSIRLVHVMKFSDAHVWLEAADGTALRIREHSATLRVSSIGAEEPIDVMEGPAQHHLVDQMVGEDGLARKVSQIASFEVVMDVPA
eukprot:gnl/TRDRNA2_/TRDRNA2_186257_c0_seq1.p1 gnl/TRDRNA2_/TRDRNA2_186257_c0~~gnl/TRDRNA2_/TRDRNA2_186257_c0_seq1.p1  ORF type:complete len:348 (+),score=51.51 gnl/TRDRNA2_/TRDRNA2_186257_c0_seq1:90-1133(+)